MAESDIELTILLSPYKLLGESTTYIKVKCLIDQMMSTTIDSKRVTDALQIGYLGSERALEFSG